MFQRLVALAVALSLPSPALAEISPALRTSADSSLSGAASKDMVEARASAAAAFGAGIGTGNAPSEPGTAVVIPPSSRVPNLLGPSAPSEGVPDGVPAPEKDWNPKEKGWNGFKNGFGKGFAWTETPAMKIYEAGFAKGSYFWIPTPFYFFTTATAIVTGLVLAPVALAVGAARGIYGAVAGEKEF